jgi:transcriptional regulator with XRE-family HTH domain
MEYSRWTKYLKILRLRKTWTQADVAMKLGISRSQYSATESGRSVVNYTHLLNLSKVFELPIENLLAMTSVLELTPGEKKLLRKTSPVIKTQGQSSKRRQSDNGVDEAYQQENFLPNGETQTSRRTAKRTSKQDRGRPKGSRVIICMCERRIYGRPGEHVQCQYCGAFTTMPRD